ncbi:SRPBCC family protein [Glycomyces xiaoerkulensis]|uniref:SRPBCC family protein n=1 Tax=Glycomyces xiaoerkulensis TaxID=2038139 RepID=UPI000C267C99|nr:SRPBCC family protein [Glycomyces xiaoerkulensis]
MKEHRSSRTVSAPPERIAELVCDPARLPDWNPALAEVDAEGAAEERRRYRIRAVRGLRGYLVYTLISPECIEMTLQVQGLREESYWLLEPSGDRTHVEHGFSHTGLLGRLLGPAFQGVAELRLDRLADRATA